MAHTKSDEAPPLRRKRVRFHEVQIHIHQVRLGDNPSVSSGPPITLDWEPSESISFDLDELEKLHGNESKKVERVSADTREGWVRNFGHSTDSIRNALAEVEEIRHSRQTTKIAASSKRNTSPQKACQSATGFWGWFPNQIRGEKDSAPKLPHRRVPSCEGDLVGCQIKIQHEQINLP